MAEKTLICKCAFCLRKNKDGMLLNISTYNRHRVRNQEFSEKDDVEEISEMSIEQNLLTEIDMYHYMEEENIQLRADEADNMYQQQNDLNIIDEDSDIDFNDDNEYYSDYNNEENDSDNDDDDDDDDDESEETDDDTDEDTMQIDNDSNTTPSKKIIEGLKILYLKSLYNFTESAYDDIMKVFTTDNLSLYKVKKYLKEITGLVPIFYDMCINSCICYVGDYQSYTNCPICNEPRFDAKRKAKKVMPYLSIKDRLKIQFNDKNRAKELLYRHEYITSKTDADLDDIFDGKIYKELVNQKIYLKIKEMLHLQLHVMDIKFLSKKLMIVGYFL